MKKAQSVLDKIETVILCVTLFVMLIITAGNVLSRKLLGSSLAFVEELTVILFIFSSLVGAGVAAKKGSLIGLTLLYDICPKKFRRVFFVVFLIASLFFVAILIYYGIDMVISEIESGMSTPALGVPQWVFGLSIPVGFLFLGIRLVEYSIRMLMKKEEEL